MTLKETMNEITALGGKIRIKAAALQKAAKDPNTSMQDLQKKQKELIQMEKRMNSLKKNYETRKAAQTSRASVKTGAGRKSILASNEYARAFAYAVVNGLNQKNGRGNEKVKILFDALTEGGGTPAGTDGGFLVPEDIDHSIRELKRELNPLSAHFNIEYVTAPTGWRVLDTAPTAGMSKVNEMATIGSEDQPAFKKVEYSTDKYGLIVPVSNELASDEVANLFDYLARWFAKKEVLTENALILTELKKLTAAALTAASPDAGIKKALNVALDPAVSVSAKIITNQDGFDALDQVKDDTGRPLLQPDPVNATLYRIYGREVVVVSNAVMASAQSGSGSSAKTTADFFIGDGREFATLFMRQGLEVASTDIGGNAWKTDSIEVRGLTRMGITVFDDKAMVRRTLEV